MALRAKEPALNNYLSVKKQTVNNTLILLISWYVPLALIVVERCAMFYHYYLTTVYTLGVLTITYAVLNVTMDGMKGIHESGSESTKTASSG